MTQAELITLARQCKTIDDLLTCAKTNDIALTTEEAEAVLARLHPATTELSDDELDNVAGGCSSDGGGSDGWGGGIIAGHEIPGLSGDKPDVKSNLI